MGEYRVDTQDWQRWPKALIMRRVWSTNGHNRHREVRRYVPDGYAKEVERENENLRHMAEYYTDWAHDEVMKARSRESRERASTDRLRDRIHEIAADRDRLKLENEKLRKLAEVLVNCGRKYHTMNGSCPMFDADAEDDDFCGAVQMARDLGIEVDE